MGRLVKLIGGELVIAHTRVATPTYTLRVSDYAGGANPPDGWAYYADDVERADFAAPWVQPAGAHDAYALGTLVSHQGTQWRSQIAGNVWQPGVSGWADATTDIPAWLQPSGAHDAYVAGAVVRHGGSIWTSLVEANVWAPGVANWRKTALVPPSGVAPPAAWVQPSGAGDAYALGAVVSHQGKTWVSTVAGNVWAPGVYGWAEQ